MVTRVEWRKPALTSPQVDDIRQRVEGTMWREHFSSPAFQAHLARVFKVSASTIDNVINYRGAYAARRKTATAL